MEIALINVSKLSLIFGSKSKAQEIIYLLREAKKVVRQGFYGSELPAVETFCQKNNLFLAKSKFKILLADETSFSDKGIKISSDDPRSGMYFVYISKNEREGWLASYYELINDTDELGRLLGYPNCCIDFFVKRFTPDNPNLQLKPTNMFTNLTKRSQDAVLISHFPCSSECLQSINLGQKFLWIIAREDQQRSEELISLLSIPPSE